MKLLKPNGKLHLNETLPTSDTNVSDLKEKLFSILKINGFTNITEKNCNETSTKSSELKQDYKIIISAQKPNYEIGSSVKINLGVKSGPTETVASVWKIDCDDDNEETIDANNLLDDEDLKKPDPSSLKGTIIRNSLKNCVFCFT